MEYQLNTLLNSTAEEQRFCVILPFSPVNAPDLQESALCSYRSADIFTLRLAEAAVERTKADEIKEAVTRALSKPNHTFSVDSVVLRPDQLKTLGFVIFASRT